MYLRMLQKRYEQPAIESVVVQYVLETGKTKGGRAKLQVSVLYLLFW